MDINVGNSNSVAWRNLRVVQATAATSSASIIVRNIQPAQEIIALQFDIPPAVFKTAKIVVRFDDGLAKPRCANSNGFRPLLES